MTMKKYTFQIIATAWIIAFSIFACTDRKVKPPTNPPIVTGGDTAAFWICQTITDLPIFQQRAVAGKNKQWPNGSTLTYLHLGTVTAEQKADFRRACDSYEAAGNIKYVEVFSNPATLRIGWQAGQGAWSYVGVDCQSIPQTSPTMNIGFKGQDRYYDICLHELGHSNSLKHEHQNPNNPFDFDKPNVYHDLQLPPNQWTVSQIDQQVLNPENPANVIATNRDDKSIMMYGMPPSWFKNRIGVPATKVLSDVDKSFFANLYKKPGIPTTTTKTIATIQADSIKAAAKNLSDMVNRILK